MHLNRRGGGESVTTLTQRLWLSKKKKTLEITWRAGGTRGGEQEAARGAALVDVGARLIRGPWIKKIKE